MGLFDCDCVCAAPPDYSSTAAATEEAAKYAYKSAAEDLAFRKQVYEESKPKQQQLQDLATQIAQQQLGIADANQQRANEQWAQHQRTFAPQERLMAADALASQYLSPEDQAKMLEIMNDTSLTPLEREQALNVLAQRGEQAMIAQTTANADELENQLGLRATDYYNREKARAMEDELRARIQNNAAINSAYNQQARDLARHGFNASRIANAAANLANQQALARVQANNQMYGLTANRLRGAEDVSNQIRWQGQDTARQMRQSAKEQTANKYAGLRAGAASFGRNMPNTAGQAYGLATGAGTQAVGNQSTGFQSGLPYANFVAQGTGNQMAAAKLQSSNALGMAGLMSQDYRTAQSGYNNMESSGLGSILGPIAGAATNYALTTWSDRRLKKNIIEIGEWMDGIHVYLFEYLWGGKQRIGFMADEVEKVFPEAVYEDERGYKMVDYGMLGVGHGA